MAQSGTGITMSDREMAQGIVPFADTAEEWHRLAARLKELKSDRKYTLLRAIHGPFGKWDALRKVELAKIRKAKRAALEMAGSKYTVDRLDDLARSSDEYAVAFVADGVEQDSEYQRLNAEIEEIEHTMKAIEMRVNREQTILRLATREPL